MDITTFSQKIKQKYPEYQTVDDVTLVNKFIEKYPVYKSQVNLGQETKKGFTDAGQDIKQIGTEIKDSLKKRGAIVQASKNDPTVSPASTFNRTGAQAMGLVSDTLGSVVKGAVKTVLPQELETGIKQGIGAGVQGVSEITDKYQTLKETKPMMARSLNMLLGFTPDVALGVKDIVTGYNKLKETNPRAAQTVDDLLSVGQFGLDVATAGVGESVAKTGVKAGANITKEAGEQLLKTGNKINKTATKTLDLVKNKVGTPAPTLEKAVGQVVQGKSDDIITAQKAIQSIDTKGVKTYKDLANKLQEKKKELVNTVDNELDKDITIYPIEQLATKATTKSGKEVIINYVDKALNNLKEFYDTTGDVVKSAEIDDLINKKAFTRKEVNNLSRIYNNEFGSKAFSKVGEPLTSVNAQAYENTRKGLKDVARQGIGGVEAKLADESLSAIYNTEKLVKKNIEAVNKLQQRINERGLLEKAGNMVSKYGDILTGGTIRGLVGGLLPRGAGYKVLNALDLEEQLAKNLDIINKAIITKTDDDLVNAIKKLDFSTNNK